MMACRVAPAGCTLAGVTLAAKWTVEVIDARYSEWGAAQAI